MGASTAAATVIAIALKSEIQRARPGAEFALVTAEGYSMPSTAAAMSAAALGPLIALTRSAPGRRRALLSVVAVQLIVVFALLYLGAHWLTDTIVGTALGSAVGGIVL